LDLSLCSSGLSVHFKWSILSTFYESDHYLVNIHTATSHPEESHHTNWITGGWLVELTNSILWWQWILECQLNGWKFHRQFFELLILYSKVVC
jgi:hypothetical protein